MLRNILLPLISLVSGLLSLFIDPKTDRAKAWMVVAVLAASSIATGVYGYQDQQAQAQAALDAQQQRKELDYLVSVAQSQGTLARNEGDSEPPSVVPSPAAPHAVEKPNAVVPPPGQKPIIQYFAKSTDSDAVTKALQSGGFEFVRVPGQRAEATNCIWVGSAVSLGNVKAVATALVRAGVPLRAIRQFRESSGPKANLIEIGADRTLENAPALTEDQIQSMSQVPRRDTAGTTGH